MLSPATKFIVSRPCATNPVIDALLAFVGTCPDKSQYLNVLFIDTLISPVFNSVTSNPASVSKYTALMSANLVELISVPIIVPNVIGNPIGPLIADFGMVLLGY